MMGNAAAAKIMIIVVATNNSIKVKAKLARIRFTIDSLLLLLPGKNGAGVDLKIVRIENRRFRIEAKQPVVI